MRTLLANIIKSAKKEIITLVGAALLSCFAVGCEDGSRFEGKSLEEIVSMVDSVSEAQQFINDEIDYAHCDVDGGYQRPVALNGAEVQGFRRTFERKMGVCRDGSVAVAAMLQDNGFPALILDVHYDADGYSVFVYQDEQGNWGSAGINASDRRHSVFGSLESLARDVAKGRNYKGFTLYDLSLVNLVEGTNGGLVMKEAFKKTQVTSEGVVDYQVEKAGDGYSRKWKALLPENASYHTIYTSDLFEDFTHNVTETPEGVVDNTWQVLQRAYSMLPVNSITTTVSNGETCTSQVWTMYTSFNELLQRNIEFRRSGVLKMYEEDSREYTGSSLSAQIVKRSNDGDYIFDNITRIELGPDGNTVYFDSNADGIWDSITTG